MTGKSETSSKVKSSNYDLAANDMPGNLITQTQLKVRSTLLAADDVGGINKIYSSLIREERLRMGTKPNSERTDVMSFAVQSGGGNMSRNEPRLESKEASQWWPDRSKAPGRGSGRGRGSQRSAPFTRQGRGSFNAPRANVASNSIHPSATASTSKPALGDLEKSGLLGLTEDQWQLLKATFQEQTPTTSSMTEESRTPSSTEWPSINEAGNELPHSENPVLSDPSNTACENENEATCGTSDEVTGDSTDRGGSNSSVDPNIDNGSSQLGRGHRHKQPSVLLRDFVTHTETEDGLKFPCGKNKVLAYNDDAVI
ncbi:hypothetical protein POM88_040697 [Heracleum sosnowskyi]|uniref:Uncharacterized protein n=1 Tax=Heracleum sosnowskyi TaxID=360622 RepID=A0AAD8HDM9_9APIA|nr:hypothetical protein POM88_040697 [Heracleum sosnowskyi]